MKAQMKKPCKDCPFRKTRPIALRGERVAQIRDSLTHEDVAFHCHKTTSGMDGEPYSASSDHKICAGSMLMMHQEQTYHGNLVHRLGEMCGELDISQTKGEELIFGSWDEMIAAMEVD